MIPTRSEADEFFSIFCHEILQFEIVSPNRIEVLVQDVMNDHLTIWIWADNLLSTRGHRANGGFWYRTP